MKRYRESFASLMLVVIIVVMTLAGCSMLRPNLNATSPPPPITYSAIVNNCSVPTESHQVPPSPLNPAPYIVIFFESCLERDKVVVILWPGENTDLNQQFGHLLGLHFKETLSFRELQGYTYERVGPIPDDDDASWMLVYHLVPE